NTDSLTGLPNRSYFQVSHANLVRKRVQHALLLLDLDDFKKINDSLGHDVGDQILTQVAERILELGRIYDTLYRLGGDEFVLLFEYTGDVSFITAMSTKLLERLSQPFQINDQQGVFVAASIGVVVYPIDGPSSPELLQNAHIAMYQAKSKGGQNYQFFHE